jgi:hypothetical protein
VKTLNIFKKKVARYESRANSKQDDGFFVIHKVGPVFQFNIPDSKHKENKNDKNEIVAEESTVQ